MCPLGFQLGSIAFMRLLLAVFQAGALVILQQAVLAAEVALTEAAVADNSLRRLAALLGGATDSLGSHGVWSRRQFEGGEKTKGSTAE